ncbi:HEAT repeat domain-containing protein [Synechocystis sp. PCC 7339]|uniref:HEAT repeat domain-containing protein n=1 Tax=unclassified Synechocystis TaxID=2640012 RepID=UPI001BAF9266|nr:MULTISPECIES: HEAT repeat domain-containing protein [unclassified Synechocystis]QUS62449.1 HEAT repeat domain-containing protein [Synechocystis sp. PCC 7338]UAJ74398.1 HEAT repeat domain-containing protein [Synechocystis sp. PCC 7339]
MSEAAVNPAYTLDQAIANLQQTEDASARYYAAWWIGRFRAAQPETIAALLVALEDESDRSPDSGYPLRRNAAKALGKLGDRQVVPALIKALDCEDYYVRESAAQALEGLEDTRAIEPLMAKLTGGLEAAQLVEGKPHLVQPYEAIIEALGALCAIESIGLIEPFLEHFSPKVQYAAARALFQLTGDNHYGDLLITALGGADLQLRRSAMMDLGATGYLPGAQGIAKTFAENSLKLIALRDLWAAHRQKQENSESTTLSPASREILDLMDSLL